MKKYHLKKEIIQEIQNGANIEAACQKVGISVATFYNWKKNKHFRSQLRVKTRVEAKKDTYNPKNEYIEILEFLATKDFLHADHRAELLQKLKNIFNHKNQ